jgi:two-component system, NarL family, sensor histidine kinase NreB
LINKRQDGNLRVTDESLSDGTIVLDQAGIIHSISANVLQLFGLNEGDISGKFIQSILPEIDRTGQEQGSIHQQLAKHKEGHTFPIVFRKNSFLFNNETYEILIFLNIDHLESEYQKVLNELIDFKFALDESTIVAITNEKGIITYVNNQFCQISKYTREELIGQDHRIINSHLHSKQFFKELWKTISSGKVWKGEIRNKSKDGTYYWVDTTIVPFLNEKGKPYQYLAIRSEITDRKRVEKELQKMLTRIIEVQEEERTRLSRNLHDAFGQNLYSHLITISRLHAEIEHPLLEQMQKEAKNSIEEVREISWELRPSVLDDLGLVPAIRSFLNRFSEHYNIDVYFECVLKQRLGDSAETAIYRIIQEALTNTRKYADVQEATVTIRELDQVIRVMIEDKGRGFDKGKLSTGVGLFSIEERARLVGGVLDIITSLGQGTKVILEIPLGHAHNL